MTKNKRKIIQTIFLFCLVSVFLVTAIPTYVRAENSVISYIYHRHVGSPDVPGGCYDAPVYHQHSGSASQGGDCYSQPVYHTHAGDENHLGGCYTEAVYHEHTGDSGTAGGCYQEKYHEHSSGCYRTENCTIVTESVSYCFRTWYETCYHHGEVVHGEWNAVRRHQNCGAGTFASTVSICNSCMALPSSQHGYGILNCSQSGAVEGYVLGCGKNESTIEHYEVGCHKSEGTDIDSYALTCPKTSTSVDSYGLNCGFDPAEPVGVIKLANLTEGTGEQVLLEATFEDYTDGELRVKDIPFVWNDSSGAELAVSTGQLTVNNNGNYRVTLQTTNENLQPESLTVTIAVDNIVRKPPVPTDDGNGNGDNNNNNTDNGGDGTDSQPDQKPSPKPTVIPSPVIEAQEPSGTATPGKIKVKETAKPQTPVKAPETKKITAKTKEVLPEENMAAAEDTVEVNQAVQKPSFFASPLVQVLSLTFGGLVAILGIIWLLLMLFRNVIIYCDNGEGRYCFIGIGLVRREDTFVLNISEQISNRAETDRYCLKPGLLFCKQHHQEELIVRLGERNISLFIDKEMKFNGRP